MGFKKNWDVADVSNQIHCLIREVQSPYNDGFTSWHCKQDLYQLHYLIESALKQCPNFGEMEQQWLHDQEKKHIIKILKS